MSARSAMEQLKSLLGIWYTDSPTWPPAPGVQQAQKLLARVERDHLESLAEYIRTIKEVTARGQSSTERIAEMRAMADEALLNGGRGKHDDPAYYSRNLAILLRQALDEIEGYRASRTGTRRRPLADHTTTADASRFRDDCPECGEYECVCREPEAKSRCTACGAALGSTQMVGGRCIHCGD